jgi:hypothetical protein
LARGFTLPLLGGLGEIALVLEAQREGDVSQTHDGIQEEAAGLFLSYFGEQIAETGPEVMQLALQLSHGQAKHPGNRFSGVASRSPNGACGSSASMRTACTATERRWKTHAKRYIATVDWNPWTKREGERGAGIQRRQPVMAINKPCPTHPGRYVQSLHLKPTRKSTHPGLPMYPVSRQRCCFGVLLSQQIFGSEHYAKTQHFIHAI